MEVESEAQRLKEEQEIRERDLKRQKEKEERERRAALEREAEEKRRREAEERQIEEEKRRKRQEEEWRRLGSDIIQDLPPVPPSVVNDGLVDMWYLDDETSKPTLRLASLKKGRKRDAPTPTLQQLKELGIIYFNISLNDFTVVKQIVKERVYKHTDEVKLSQTCKDEQFLERWFQEHYNEDEQIRIVIDGSCFMDVRSKQDKWIRIHAKVGDLFIFPPGLYQRSTLDEDDFVALYRIFRDSTRFAPIYRSNPRAESQKSQILNAVYGKVSMNSAAVTAENVLAHVSHLTPADVSELLVRGTLATNTVSSPGAAVRFGQVTHGFKRAASYTKLHCLRWSAAGPATAPAACFPLVGDVMTCEYVNDKLRVVLKDEAVTYFAPQRDRNDLLDALLLVNYDNKTCNRRFQRIYSSWALYAQLLPYKERGGLSTNTQAMELFSKKLIMWLFSYFARESGTQIMLNQLEMAFPLLAGWPIQERRLFVEEAVSRFSAGIFSYYDDRVINRCRTPVNALSLLSLEELRSVTSTEQATAALMFNVQMQHNALLEALQLIIDCWGKQSPDLQLSLISHAVALLLSHVAETSSLRSSAGVRAWARVTAFRHITQLSSSPAEDTARRIVSLVRTQKQSKKSACTEIQEKLMVLVLNGDMAHENGVNVQGAVLNDDESVFLDSTAPQQQSDTNVVWKIDRNSFCHWVVPSSQSLVKKDTSPTPNKVSAFLSSVVTAGPRFQLSRPLLKCAPAEGHLCLQLNLGAVSSENCGNTLWHSVRASKRGRTEN